MDRRDSVTLESSRPRCINCALAIPRNTLIHSVGSVHASKREILTSWVTPTLVTRDHIICHNCYLLIQEGTIGSPEVGHQSVCFACGVSLLRTSRRRTYQIRPDSLQRDVILQWTPLHLVSRLERACAACWRAATRIVNRQQQHDLHRPIGSEEIQTTDEPSSRITSSIYRRAASTANHCLYMNCTGPERLLIPLSIRETVLKNYRFYIPASARICQQHLDHGRWGELTSTLTDFTAQQFDEMMGIMERLSVRNVLDFSNPSNMSPDMCHYWLGMSPDQFNELMLTVPTLGEKVPDAGLALSIFLIKLRTGDSNERLATLFKIPRSTLERYMDKARECLINEFVPQYLGFNHMSVQEVAARNKIIPEGLFGNPELSPDTKPAFIMCDATYIFVQKSSNYKFQKNTYSLQKLDNLVKPFMLVCCDGHILDCMGPFKATTNDANITSLDLHRDDGNLTSFFRVGDIFILDRGFRDVIADLEGFRTHMPETVNENEFQLTTLQANNSRFVTMCRWVVEAVNGRIKRDFRLFRHVYNNRAAKHLMDDLKIACALLNKYHKLIEDPPEAALYVTIAKARHSLHNHLTDFVNRENMNRRSALFRTIDGYNPHLDTFPRLSVNDLKRFALGTYQLKQAVSYYGEHVRQTGTYTIEINNEVDQDIPLVLGQNNYLLRGRIRSRHVSGRTYFIYLLISKNQEVVNTLDAIVGYCCNCRVGRRTVGCCAHIMTVVWYLSWARYNDVNAPASYLDDFFIEYEE